MSALPPHTPRKATFDTGTPLSTPVATRLPHTHVVQASPHYATTRRHSLYGTEDRVVIDPGSLIWKVGFSGEGRPRAVFYASGRDGIPLWGLNRATDPNARAEEDRLLSYWIEKCLRSVFHQYLLTDPKSRKVILVEHPLLPLHVKEIIARKLFDNLQVPSVSFASSPLLSLFSTGRITGLVLDCGHLESVALPIFAARPLFPMLQTTPLAGSRLRSHLKALILIYGTYLPPPTTLSGAANIPSASRSTRVPEEALTDAVMEEIVTRCCFVGDVMDSGDEEEEDLRAVTPGMSDSDVPPRSDSARSESEYSHVGGQSHVSSSQPMSEFSVISGSGVAGPISSGRGDRGEGHLQSLAAMYTRHSTATQLNMKIQPPPSQQTNTGLGTLVLPGWVRERACEVLFEGGDVDEGSVAEVILDCLLKVPVDLRKTLASSILVAGGTTMIPGFVQRLYAELLRAVNPLINAPAPRQPTRPGRPPPPRYDRYATLRPLIPYFAIVNNPSPKPATSERAAANSGRAPAFSPHTMAWIGGSLTGSLKTGGVEVSREKWDEQDEQPPQEDEDEDLRIITNPNGPGNAATRLPDWTRIPLPTGAPPARSVTTA